MNRNKPFVYSMAFLSLTVPAPGRFVFGIVLVLELILIEIFGVLSNALATKLKFGDIRTYFVMFIMISLTILYRQLIAITYPEIVLSLGFILYFPIASAYILYNMFSDIDKPMGQRLKSNLIKTLKFSIAVLFFFLFRDIAGFGTFTFFGKGHRIFEKVMFNPDKIGLFTFFASIPGALILMGVMIYLFIFFKNRVIYHVEGQEKITISENKGEAEK